MTLQEFAEKYKVKIRKDSCDDHGVYGKVKGAKRTEDNHHVYTSGGEFFVYLNFPTVGRWNNTRKRLMAAGADPFMTCTYDGLMTFDPENATLVRLIFRISKIRVKREMTDEQKAKLRERLAK
jgi:hypothetical protein